MKDNNLRSMGRRELMEIIYEQKKREAELEGKLAEAERKLADRTIAIANAGSIAEASLALNGVFQAAQAAADAYVQSVERDCARRIRETDEATAARWDEFKRAVEQVLNDHPELQKFFR